uniref:TERF1-interacting nuclear factor 2 isoform X5 n=1 Tax=Podarcis muralis TaxID=64176 RepID=UPI00109F7303|nr:TERF1-interacting nuclear factor 2 isoform X5 [Podarcis muralis]
MPGVSGRRRRPERAPELRSGSGSRKSGEGRVKRAHAQPEVRPPEARPRANGCQGQRRRAMAAMEEEEAEAIGGAAPDPCVALRLVAAAAWHVVQKQQVHDFPRVLALLAAVKEVAPDLVHFRHYAKLRLGLQAKVIMNMLQEQQPNGKIYDALDTFFPEGETQPHSKATPQDMEMVRVAQENFRDLVFGLLSDRREREKYVQEHLEKDYGEAFMQVVEELFHDYLWQLEKTLPEPHLQQLLDATCLQGPSGTPQPDSSILSHYLSAMGHQTAGIPPDVDWATREWKKSRILSWIQAVTDAVPLSSRETTSAPGTTPSSPRCSSTLATPRNQCARSSAAVTSHLT